MTAILATIPGVRHAFVPTRLARRAGDLPEANAKTKFQCRLMREARHAETKTKFQCRLMREARDAETKTKFQCRLMREARDAETKREQA